MTQSRTAGRSGPARCECKGFFSDVCTTWGGFQLKGTSLKVSGLQLKSLKRQRSGGKGTALQLRGRPRNGNCFPKKKGNITKKSVVSPDMKYHPGAFVCFYMCGKANTHTHTRAETHQLSTHIHRTNSSIMVLQTVLLTSTDPTETDLCERPAVALTTAPSY